MWTRHHKRRNTGRLIVPAIATLEGELEALREARRKLERRVSLLNDGSLERDMLDEQARRALNLARKNEIVIFRTGGSLN